MTAGGDDEVRTRPLWSGAFSRLRMRKAEKRNQSFWREALALHDSVTVQVTRRVLIFGAFALAVCVVNDRVEHIDLGIEVAPYEVAGAALGLLLVLRTNAGYDRWWEGRKLWGGIVNETRNLALTALAHGPDDPSWRDRVVRLTTAFAHACRHSLRGQREVPEIVALLGDEEAACVAASGHMPDDVALRIARILREGCERHGMDRFAFLLAEHARALLIDHIGGCERILKAPLPRSYSINIRRFIALFLGTLPFALLPKVGWLTPLVTILVAYPILSLDDIGVELQNPFNLRNLDHLPLDAICTTIEHDLRSLLAESGPRGPGGMIAEPPD